ncbi:hypothetical protein [Nocardia tengchongensis]
MFAPLPPMPALPDPHAVFITHEDTPRALTEATLDWVPRHSHRRRRNALRWLITAGVLYSLWSLSGLLIGLAACAALVGVYRRRWNSDPARTFAMFSSVAAPGTVMATRFGPDAFDIQLGADSHRRIRYASIRDLTVTTAAVTFREGWHYHTYPRELFPDNTLELLAAPAPGTAPAAPAHPGLPALPPIPSLTEPTTVYFVEPGTTSRLVRVPARRYRVRRAIVFTVLAAIYLAALYLIRGGAAVPAAAAGILVLATGFSIAYVVDRNKRERLLAQRFPPGTAFAARFGPDTADLHVGSLRTRIQYEWIKNIVVEDGVVELAGIDGGVYPRELFPDSVIAYIHALNAEVAASR